MIFDIKAFLDTLFSDIFFMPALTTLGVTFIAMAGAMILGFGGALAALSRFAALRRIVLPQALAVIIPPTGNQFIAMLKTTSLLFAIAVPEIFSTGTNIYSQNFRYFEVLLVVSIWYLVLTALLTAIQKMIERRFASRKSRKLEALPVLEHG